MPARVASVRHVVKGAVHLGARVLGRVPVAQIMAVEALAHGLVRSIAQRGVDAQGERGDAEHHGPHGGGMERLGSWKKM